MMARRTWVKVEPTKKRQTAGKATGPRTIHQLKITLEDVDPPIWRRVQVRSGISLYKLHRVIQAAMGWKDYHLHEFEVQDVAYGMTDPATDPPAGLLSDKDHKLGEVVPGPEAAFLYNYDFGDDWLLRVEVEKVIPPEPDRPYPVCLAGERSGPPEDSGGPGGYQDMLEALADPDHPDREEILDWIGENYNPEAFDLQALNRRLARLR